MNGFGWLAGGIANKFDGSAMVERRVPVLAMRIEDDTDWNQRLVG